MKKNNAFRRAAALMAALSITVSLAAPAFAGTYYIDNGDITVTKNADGSQTVEQNGTSNNDSDEIIITTTGAAITTLESDLEGPAAEDSGFGPVAEDNYQPAQPEDAEKPEGADQPKDADRQESADQQAAPAAAPAGSTPVNPKDDGFWGNTITVINNFVDKALNLTLKDVKIDVSDTGDDLFAYDDTQKGKAALSVQGDGNVEIELDGNNELKSGKGRAGLEKTSTGTLTLKDDNKEAGSLTATGGMSGAGIGGGFQGNGENITITGGTVTATGGESGGAIDGGGAGIGGGNGGDNGNGGVGNNITITGGTVTATGGFNAAGIGGGNNGNGENITIKGGTVNATGGEGGAGLGGGSNNNGNGGNGKNITITGGTVNAAGGVTAAGIGGGGNGGSGENITINGGTVNAAGGDAAAGIGGGVNGNGNNITITGGKVTAAGGVTAAGIGGGQYGNGENITIKSGTVNAAGGEGGAGIGGGQLGSGEDITIKGGKVTAAGGDYAAGIGGGDNGNGDRITITGGVVNAAGGVTAAGIGGGREGGGSKVTVSGAAQVTTTAGKSDVLYGLYGAGATIGSGGSRTPGGELVDGKEIQADISHLDPGYIHHILYNRDGTTIKREWWEPVRTPLDGKSLDLHVETLKGAPLPFNIRQQGSTLRVTTDNLSARLHGTRQALETLQEQGVEQIQFVTTLKTTTLSVAELLAEGGSWFALEHDGLGSRRLSAAQAESLKCWRH